MANLRSYRVKALDGVLNSSTFTPITTVGNWNNLCVSNKGGAATVSLRTDPDDEDTEVDVLVGSEFNVAVPLTQQLQRVYGSRFVDGQTCAYLKVASGTGEGTVIVWA